MAEIHRLVASVDIPSTAFEEVKVELLSESAIVGLFSEIFETELISFVTVISLETLDTLSADKTVKI